MLSFFKNLFSSNNDSIINALSDKPFLVDVRTAQEFNAGHVKGSVNIPVNVISSNINKFHNKKNVIVFCRSGSRSGMAKTILINKGITNVINGGTWTKINDLINKSN